MLQRREEVRLVQAELGLLARRGPPGPARAGACRCGSAARSSRSAEVARRPRSAMRSNSVGRASAPCSPGGGRPGASAGPAARRSAQGRRPWPPPPGPCSRRSRAGRPRRPRGRPPAGCVLLTATRVMSSGRRPARAAARAMRSRTAATRSAITSWASAPASSPWRWPRSGRWSGSCDRYFSRCAMASGDLVLADRDRAQVVVDLGVGRGRARGLLEGGRGLFVPCRR